MRAFGIKQTRQEWQEMTEVNLVVHDFPVIRLGRGEVMVADATHDGLPALWFGKDGQGLGALDLEMNRYANDGETLAVFTIADIRGIDAVEKALARLRAQILADGDHTGGQA
jgi:hypothetical protein